MHKSCSPNLIVIIIFLCSLFLPVDSSRAVTNQTEVEEPLTIDVCKKLFEELEREAESPDDSIRLEKKKTCEILLKQTNTQDQEQEATVPDTESPEETNEEVGT